MKQTLIIIFILTTFLHVGAQQQPINKEKARQLGAEAVTMINNGDFDAAIKKLTEADSLDNTTIAYQFEKALAYKQKGKYYKASGILEMISINPEADERVYILWANCLDQLGKYEEAYNHLNEALKKFPNSGKIYMEIGREHYNMEERKDAVGSWETGIQTDPTVAGNYYFLSSSYFLNGNFTWASIYSEIFVNLTDNEKFIFDASQICYDIYKTAFYVKTGDSTEIHFTKIIIQRAEEPDPKSLDFPLAFQYVMEKAAKGILPKDSTSFTLDNLIEVKKKFTELWFQYGLGDKYPNVLFAYHKLLLDNNYLDVYYHEIFAWGDKEKFKEWLRNNKETYNEYLSWKKENKLVIDKDNYISKMKYQ
jgi:Tfp pilus assembly protein PilF